MIPGWGMLATTLLHRDGTIDVLRWETDRFRVIAEDVDEDAALDLVESFYNGEQCPS